MYEGKSNRYSFAAGVLLLISCLSFAYEWLIDPLRTVGGHYTDKGFFEYLKSLYTSESSSRGEIAQTVLIVALALLLNKSFAKWICLAVIAVATIGFLLEAVLCIGQYVSSSWAWQKGHLDRVFFSYSRHDTFYMTAGYTPVSYFTRAAIAVLVALWGMGRCKANAQK